MWKVGWRPKIQENFQRPVIEYPLHTSMAIGRDLRDLLDLYDLYDLINHALQALLEWCFNKEIDIAIKHILTITGLGASA